MVYDCMPFFNELDILDMRLHIMDPIVDYFVIEESDVTFSGQKKDMIFDQNRERFKEFLDKIIYVPVTNCPVGIGTHEMDQFQKDHLLEGIKNCAPDDIIIFSDVDEIPNPKLLVSLYDKIEPDKIYHLAQRMFYCFLNMEETSGNLLSNSGEFAGFEGSDRQWLGTKIFRYQALKGRGFFDLRDKAAKENGVRVPDGGWHFGYMGGDKETNLAKRVSDKVVAAAHQEYNEKEILVQIVDRIHTGQDIFGREAKFERVEIDDSFPAYLREHLSEYKYLLMPEFNGFQIKWTKCMMVVKRKCRRVFRGINRVLRKLHVVKE